MKMLLKIAATMSHEEMLKVLGLPKNASPEDVKKAYRKFSMKNHPDLGKGDASLFQKITDAKGTHYDKSWKRQKVDTGGLGGGGSTGGFGSNWTDAEKKQYQDAQYRAHGFRGHDDYKRQRSEAIKGLVGIGAVNLGATGLIHGASHYGAKRGKNQIQRDVNRKARNWGMVGSGLGAAGSMLAKRKMLGQAWKADKGVGGAAGLALGSGGAFWGGLAGNLAGNLKAQHDLKKKHGKSKVRRAMRQR